jgi:Flp pilus assembly pilin Flp
MLVGRQLSASSRTATSKMRIGFARHVGFSKGNWEGIGMLRFIAKVATSLLLCVRSTAERGATAVEYSMLAALIAGVIVAVVGALGQHVLGLFSSLPLDIWP